jgi:hypothetical protein
MRSLTRLRVVRSVRARPDALARRAFGARLCCCSIIQLLPRRAALRLARLTRIWTLLVDLHAAAKA